MFGLGWVELLIIGGVISLIAGPVALRRVVRSARDLEQTKRDLTGPGALRRLLGDDPDEADEPGGPAERGEG